MSAPEKTSSPRRVLLVHNNADLYGASRMLLRWLRCLDRQRFSALVVLPENGPLKELIEAEGVEVILHPRLSVLNRSIFHPWRFLLFCLNFPVSTFFLWRLIRRQRVRLVYTNTGVILSPALGAFLARVPHVWHIREWFQEFRGLWPVLSRYIKSLSCQVVAVSNAMADQFKPRGAALVIHDGFSLEEFELPKPGVRAEFRSRHGLGEEFVVGCVGRIKWVRKGQEFLVKATGLLKRRGLYIKALIVGAPFPGNEEHLRRLELLTRELGVENQVVFTGELSDTRPTYAAMDLVVLTSAQPEPFGGVVMEGMAMGLPVIATNIGGSLDQVVEGETGRLIPPADPVALADAIEKMMHDPSGRERMGHAGRERIRTKFTLLEMTWKLEEVLEACLERREPDLRQRLQGANSSISKVRPVSVLHVHNNADLYGSSRSLLRWIKTVDRQRFQPLVVLPEDGPLKKCIEAEGVEVILHPRLSVITRPVFRSWRIGLFLLQFPCSVWWLWRLIRCRGIGLVHTNTGVVLSPALAARLAGVPHFWHIRDWFQEFSLFWPAYAGYITTFSHRVIAVSNAIADQFSRQEKVKVIPNGFALEDFEVPQEELRKELQNRYGLDQRFIVGCVGRIKLVRKGQEVLVQATAILKGRGRLINALIVGAPFPSYQDHLTQLQRMAEELGVANQVVFTGEVTDPRPAYAAMDVLAMTSVQPEPFGGVVMEAMAMSLPVIATRIGGSLDQVVEGVTGLFVPPGDATALADAIEKIMQDRELGRRMGAAGRERIRNEFSLVELTRRMEQLFAEALSSK
jgi:glycosyltransferase involved in cell wall biosynthesis